MYMHTIVISHLLIIKSIIISFIIDELHLTLIIDNMKNGVVRIKVFVLRRRFLAFLILL